MQAWGGDGVWFEDTWCEDDGDTELDFCRIGAYGIMLPSENSMTGVWITTSIAAPLAVFWLTDLELGWVDEYRNRFHEKDIS